MLARHALRASVRVRTAVPSPRGPSVNVSPSSVYSRGRTRRRAAFKAFSTADREGVLREAKNRFVRSDEVGTPVEPETAKMFVRELINSSSIFAQNDPAPSLANDELYSCLCLLGRSEFSVGDGSDQSPLSHCLNGIMASLGPGFGVAFLLDLRRLMRSYTAMVSEAIADSPDGDHLFASSLSDLARANVVVDDVVRKWFHPALLAVQRVDFAQAPTFELNAIADADTVHPVHDMTSFRGRFEDGKACFAIFHRLWVPAKTPKRNWAVAAGGAFHLEESKGLPLVAVMAAFSKAVPVSMADVEQASDSSLPDAEVACFYSINSVLGGVNGLRLGQLLLNKTIRQCVRESRQAVRRGERRETLKRFVTLSPLPGFSGWLHLKLTGDPGERDDDSISSILSETSLRSLRHLRHDDPSTLLRDTLFGGSEWWTRPDVTDALRPALLELARHYVLRERRHRRNRVLAADPVTNFHVGNGASLLQLNWLADASPRRLSESFGIMANYEYDLDQLLSRAETYQFHGTVTTL